MTTEVGAPRHRRVAPAPPPPAMAPPDPDWIGGFAVDVGEYRVGLRADAPAVLDLLREVFGRWVVEDAEATDDFGISVNRRGGAGPRLIPQLLHGRTNVLRSRSLPRLLRRLDAALGDLLPSPHRADGIAVRDMAAFVRNGAAALVPTSLAERSTAVERQVAAAGATIAEQASLRIDLASQEIAVVPGLRDWGTVPQMVADLATSPGRYALRSIAWSDSQVVVDERRSTAVARLAELVDLSATDDRQTALQDIVAISDRCVPTPIPRWDPDLAIVLDTLA
jgi:hypothetical protein